MPIVRHPRADRSADGVAVIRDFQAIPYRQTPAYRRALEEAKRQKAAIRHRVGQLWPTESGQSTSGMLRTVRFSFR